VVTSLTLDDTSIVLTGDAEAENWPAIHPSAAPRRAERPFRPLGQHTSARPHQVTHDALRDEQPRRPTWPSSPRHSGRTCGPTFRVIPDRLELPRDGDNGWGQGARWLHACEREVAMTRKRLTLPRRTA
jgi:hypothetical protein